MHIGGTSGQAQAYTPQTGKGEAVSVSQPAATAGEVVSAEAAPFINPAVNFDYQAGIAVFVIRDGETGEVKAQYPSQKVVEEYMRHGGEAQPAPTPESATPGADPVAQSQAAAAGVPLPPQAPAPTAPSAPVAPAVHTTDQVA